jgi:hypothetical protein
MVNDDAADILEALGDLCLIYDTPVHGLRSKLKTVTPGSTDAFYLLAAYCFDSARRMEYAYKVTRRFARYADSALAAEVLRDNERINAPDRSWKQVAETAEGVLLRLAREVVAEHKRLLQEAAKRGRKRR